MEIPSSGAPDRGIGGKPDNATTSAKMESKEIFEAVQSGDLTKVTSALSQMKDVNIEDEHGMSLLQAAAFKGSVEICKLLLDMGADPNGGHHDNSYSTLHFAALSGSAECCTLLLEVGGIPDSLNSVSRTPAQMAAFIGNHSCVAVINNYVQKSVINYYTIPHGQETDPKLNPAAATAFHRLVNLVNLNPVRLVRFVNDNPQIWDHLPSVVRVLNLMSEKEMKRGKDANELLSLKFHHFHFTLNMLDKERAKLSAKFDEKELRNQTVEQFIKMLLKETNGVTEYQEKLIRESVRQFPYKETMTFRQLVTSFATNPIGEGTPAYLILDGCINGQKGFHDDIYCTACGEMSKNLKKCAKCKTAQYCDKECQKLHWFEHKKVCEAARKLKLEREVLNVEKGVKEVEVK